MNALEELVKKEAKPEWRPNGKMGRALKPDDQTLILLIRKGHSDRAIFEAWLSEHEFPDGFDVEETFKKFRTALRGFREFAARNHK